MTHQGEIKTQSRGAIAALAVGANLIAWISALIGLFVWNLWVTIAVVVVAALVTIGTFWLDRKARGQMPKSLSADGFAYPSPKWLSDAERERLSDVAKAAFVLLLFEQTESGCWSKVYLYRQVARGEKLPLAHGALTGTPFALIAISSYVGDKEVEGVVLESTYRPLFETLARCLKENGKFVKGCSDSFVGKDYEYERPRHAAGACLISLMYGKIGLRDLKAVETLCTEPLEPESSSYDWAVMSRLLTQVRQIDSIPLTLRVKAGRRRKKLLARLTDPTQTPTAPHNWASPTDLHHESTNQWGTAWWTLPLLAIPSIPLGQRLKLTDRLRRFLLAQSAAEPTGHKLLATEFDELGRGTGKSVFGTGVALLSWRTLEYKKLDDSDQAKAQSQRMIQRILASIDDVIESPSSNEKPQTLEGYLGWAAICLAASSLGIHPSRNECSTAVSLVRKLNSVPINDHSPAALTRTFETIIGDQGLLKPEFVPAVARVLQKVATIYEDVNEVRTVS